MSNWALNLFERNQTTSKLQLLVAIGLVSVCVRAAAAPIPRLDSKTANAFAKLSMDSLGIAARGPAGLTQMEQAVESFRQAKFDDTLQSLVAAAEQNANLPPAKVMLARMFVVTGNGSYAKSLMEQAAVENPANADLFLLFGEIAKAEGRLSDALLNYEKSKSLDAANAERGNVHTEASLGIASVFELRGQWPQADIHLREAVKAGADGAAILKRLARVHFALENYQNAEKLLRQARERDPKTEPMEIVLGQWFHVDGQQEAAERWVRVGLEAHPSDTRVLVSAVLWAIEVEQYEQAKSFVERLAKLSTGDPSVGRMQGLVARFAGDYASAESAFQRLVTDNPGDFAASNQLALVMLEQDQPDKLRRAVQLAELNYRQYPRAVDARATLGWAYFRQGRLEDADAVFASIVPPEQVGGDSAYYAAKFHQERGRDDIAQGLLTSALSGRAAFTQRHAANALLDTLKSAEPSEN